MLESLHFNSLWPSFRRPALPLLLLLLCASSSACGPKEPGYRYGALDSSGGMQAADHLRLSMTGVNSGELMLHNYNRPEVMERVRDWRIQQFNKLHGAPAPEDPAYREIPRERSPFRQ